MTISEACLNDFEVCIVLVILIRIVLRALKNYGHTMLLNDSHKTSFTPQVLDLFCAIRHQD